MKDTIQTQILNALLTALRPLARALLRAGVGYRVRGNLQNGL
jgi:hypothetical protein